MKRDSNEISDSDLIKQYILTQREDYFSLIYKRYANKVYAKCVSILRDEEWAIDASQDIFLKIFLNLSKFEEKSQFSTRVYSITFKYCIDALRKKNKERKMFVPDSENLAEVVKEESTIEDFANMVFTFFNGRKIKKRNTIRIGQFEGKV